MPGPRFLWPGHYSAVYSLHILLVATGNVYRHVTISLLSNVLALVASAPAAALVAAGALLIHPQLLSPPGVVLGTVVLAAMLPNPGGAGLQYVMHDLSRGDYVTLGTIREGYRLGWLPALRLWATGLGILLVIVANMAFYPLGPFRHLPLVVVPLEVILISLLTLWAEVNLYAYALLFRQERSSVRLTYRNALVLTFQRPAITLGLTLTWVVILLLLTVTGITSVLGLALSASLQQVAVERLINPPKREAIRESY